MTKNNSDSSQKKVRKVGRPKKRGRKRKYYNSSKKEKKSKVKKGYSHNLSYQKVRQVLWENFSNDFADYRAFISNKSDAQGKKIKGTSIVSIVFNECKQFECTDEDIKRIYLQLNRQKNDDNVPLIPDDYFDPHPYWQLITEDWWSGLDERLWVVSSDLLFDPDYFLGIFGSDRCIDKDGEIKDIGRCNEKDGDRIVRGKAIRFQEFVNYCNQMQLQGFAEDSGEVPHFCFVGKDEQFDREAFYNEANKRWEINIIIVTPNGDREDYGFEPSEPDQDLDADLISTIVQNKKKPLEEEKVKDEVKISSDENRIKEIELALKEADVKLKEAEARIIEAETKQKEIVSKEKRSKQVDKLLDKYLAGELTAEQLERLLKLL